VFRGYFSRIKVALFIFIERLLAHFTDKIIAVSESVKSELAGLGISREDKIAVVNLGFELKKFLDIPPRQSDTLNIGIIGRLVPIKNHRLFLDAASIIIKDNPSLKVKFKVIGDGELKKDLLRYAERLGIGRYIDFLGWQRDLAKVYADLDIVALTSLNEGTPVSLIEAMASGRAVVATEVGGVRDLIGDRERGIIVKPQDPKAFSEGLLLLLRDAQLRVRLGLSARSFVSSRFTKEMLIENIEKLYKDLIAADYKIA
jgi:glycosyltransferase involved in cell wall biosynthesis